MKLIERLAVLFKTLIILSGFCVLMMSWSEEARAQYPSASFTSNVFTGCAPLSVDFTNLSTQATNYYWDFGNGNTSTLTNPTTVYLSPGAYTVTLVAINSVSGNTDTLFATNYITVLDDPIADFTAAPLSGCARNNNIAFTNLSANSNNYIWDFGDGSFSFQSNPVHSYVTPGTYTVKLIARNPYGCNDIKIRNAYITIYPNPPADFSVSQQSSCNTNEVFSFTCNTIGAIGWKWAFGDGATSTAQNPTHVYGVQGTFNVSLIVFNANGCSDTLVNPGYINIGPNLVPTFTVNSQTGCAPDTIDFTCTVPNATSWLWDFGDGTTSTLENPTHIYTASGNYTIILTVTTGVGCNGTVTLPGYITIDPIPVPAFTVNVPVGCSPHTTFFTNTSTNATTYLWSFGDGATSTDQVPFHTFADTGVYTVTLTAYSANGCSASVTHTAAVTVKSITASLTGTPRVGCAPLTVAFTGSATPAGVTWNWNFGDGNTGTGQTTSHTYNAIGNYIVSLVVTSALGCVDTITRNNFIRVVDDSTAYTVPDTILVCTPPGTVSFTDPTIGSNSWLWNFGDGTTATVRNPGHTYLTPGIYTVTLTTGMAGGCTQVFNPFAIVNVQPFLTLPITTVTTSPCAPYAVQFDNLTLNVATYLWNFGDGTTSTLQNPLHVYAQPGTYSVTLLLTSINGCVVTLSTTVTFGYQNVITVSDTTTCLGDVINFGLNPVASFTSASWNFGDGTTSALLQPTHTYGTTGSFTATVTVTDLSGCVYTFTYPNLIYVSDPISAFTINQPTSGCVPYTVQFVNNSTGATGYYWYFGDGTNASQANPSHTYNASGVYTVTLNASKKGCMRSSTITDYITVSEAQANFSFTPDSGCSPLNAAFTDLSVNAVSWLWNFGDGNTSALQNPVHTFLNQPADSVSLVITDVNGCSDSIAHTNVVVVAPEIQASDTVACNPAAISFTTTYSAVTYLWDFGDGSTSNLQNPVHTYTQTGVFSVSLTCNTTSGCTVTTLAPGLITITAPVSNFTSPTVAVCAPSLVTFVNQSTGATSWLWNFGDGTTSVTENPSHIYNVPGFYTVSLISYSASGCSDTLTLTNFISVPGTVTDFTVSATEICENTSVQFTDQSVNASNYFWNFGDGFTSSLPSPVHSYTSAGSYTVTLITSDAFGCSSFYSYPDTISVHPNPQALALVTPTMGCMPLNSVFTNLSTGADSYVWHFGTGDTAVTPDTVYAYNLAGIYFPYLIASTSFGCTDTFVYAAGIGVSGSPVPNFTANFTSNCIPATVSFTNNSTAILAPSYSWNFGNGQTSTQTNPVSIYNTSGTFQVRLIVTNVGGCSDTIIKPVTILDSPVAVATVSATSGCSPFVAVFTNTSTNSTSYLWNFGDGTTSSAAAPSHTYSTPGTYTVTLVASNSNGCSDTIVLPGNIQVNQTPNANFTRTPASGCSPLIVLFNSTSGQLSNPTYSWNFGNGQTGNLASQSINYTTAGVFPATMIVTNSNGCSDTITRNVIVNQSPDAIASVSGTSGCAPYSVTFTNTSVNAAGYLWDFGDGTSSTQTAPSHIYTAAGDYTITLIATSASGCTDTLVFNSQVHVNTTPSIAIVSSVQSGCSPVSVSFSDQSTGLVNPVYAWNFGNGQTSASPTPTIVYGAGGTFPVTLILTNQGGCSDTANSSITIYDTPVAIASTNDTVGCGPFQANFTNTSLNGTGWLWNFGDGATSTQMSPSHIYNTAGSFNVSLVVSGAGGCKDTLLFPKNIHVKATPAANFIPSAVSGCTPLAISFNNNSTGLVNPSYSWNFGNGTQSTAAQPTCTYLQNGIFAVTLIVTNSEGCTDTATASITSNITPVAQTSAIDTAGCIPHSVTFNSTSLNATSLMWNFGDGTISTASNVQHVYNAAGTYQPYLIASTAAGCSDTLYFSSPVHVYPNPVAAFTASQTSICSGSQIQFSNQSTPAVGLSYQWNIANVNYTISEPAVTIVAPGFYNASLIVVNQYGCSDTMVQSNYIQVFDTLAPNVSPILSVSVYSNTSVKIIWQNNTALDLGAYILYRYNSATSAFEEVYRDTTPDNSSMNVTSSYIDGGLNTLSKVYTYKLSTIDRCEFGLPLAALTAHTTMNVSAAPVSNDIRVNWTQYSGCPVSSYEVHRIDLVSGAATVIATVPPGTLTYLDQGFPCPYPFSYRIVATALCGSAYTSQSDTAIAIPVSILSMQKVEVVRSTVIDDKDVLTEWLPPVLLPQRVVQYQILRSTDNVNFTEIATVPAATLSYIDYDTEVHEQEYYYRVEVINDCNFNGAPSNNSSSILLKSDWLEEKTKMWWSPYLNWDTGVDYYVIEKLNYSGQWIPIKTVPGNVITTIVDQ